MSRRKLSLLAPIVMCALLACGHGLSSGPGSNGATDYFSDDDPITKPDLTGELVTSGRLMDGVPIPKTSTVAAIIQGANGVCEVDEISLDTRAETHLADGASCNFRHAVAISPDGATLYYLAALDSATTVARGASLRSLTLATGVTSEVVTISAGAGPLALSPDGRSLVYSVQAPTFVGEYLHLRDLETASDVTLAESDVGGFAFSPDGTRLVFPDRASDGHLARTLSIATRHSELLPDPLTGSLMGSQFWWTAAGLQYIVRISPCTQVCEALTNVTTGKRLGLYANTTILAWAPDGEHVAGATAWCYGPGYACLSRRIEIAVGDWATHQATIIAREDACDFSGPYGMVVSDDGNRVLYGLCSGTYLWTRS